MSISRLHTWNSDELLTAEDLNNEFNNITSQLLTAASQSDVNTGTSTTGAITPALNLTVLGVQQATTAGTSIDFSNIPSGTRQIYINFVGVSTSGTSNIIVQLGDAGGVETTGYLGSACYLAAAATSTAFTAGFGIHSAPAAASVIHGTVTLTLENSSANTWCCASLLSRSDSAAVIVGSGSKSLSQELTSVRITTAGGIDTFDAGVINIAYRR